MTVASTHNRLFTNKGKTYLLPDLLRFPPELLSRIGANHSYSVLITGETGTGKEILADYLIATDAAIKQRPVEKINCSGLPENIIDSELFGHEKGAFTGADKRRDGILKTCEGGIVFLDEIGRMPLPAQARLLRFMEDGTIRRVGSDKAEPLSPPPRIIAATNTEICKKKRFLQDLRNRFDYEIDIPPLRNRQDDIPYLISLPEFFGRDSLITGIHLSLLIEILLCDWPGNIRQLSKFCHHAMDVHLLTSDSPEDQHIILHRIDTPTPQQKHLFDGGQLFEYLVTNQQTLRSAAKSNPQIANTLRLLLTILFPKLAWPRLVLPTLSSPHPEDISLTDLSDMSLTPDPYKKYATNFLAPTTGYTPKYLMDPLTLTQTIAEVHAMIMQQPASPHHNIPSTSGCLGTLTEALTPADYESLNLVEPPVPDKTPETLATLMSELGGYSEHEIGVARLLAENRTYEEIAGRNIKGYGNKQRVSDLNQKMQEDARLTAYHTLLYRHPGRRPDETDR